MRRNRATWYNSDGVAIIQKYRSRSRLTPEPRDMVYAAAAFDNISQCRRAESNAPGVAN